MKKLVDRYTVKPIPAQDIVPVRAGYQQCAPGWTFEPSCRDSFTVQYVTSGCGTIYKDGQTFPEKTDGRMSMTVFICIIRLRK